MLGRKGHSWTEPREAEGRLAGISFWRRGSVLEEEPHLAYRRATRKAGHRRGVYVGMDAVYALTHREDGTLGTFKTLEEAGAEMVRLLTEEPSLTGDLWIEPIEAVVSEPSER